MKRNYPIPGFRNGFGAVCRVRTREHLRTLRSARTSTGGLVRPSEAGQDPGNATEILVPLATKLVGLHQNKGRCTDGETKASSRER